MNRRRCHPCRWNRRWARKRLHLLHLTRYHRYR
jgi:hypothetical protein